MPRSIASASSSAHIIGSTTATLGLTAKPAGTQRSDAMISWYSSTHSLASSGSTNENDSAPMPFSAASRMVSRREQATQSGGGGLCMGLRGPVRRRVGLLLGLGDDVARRHAPEAPVPPGEGLLDHHACDDVEGLVPGLALGLT